jgi:tripartite ATP-independent transporter DctM subunit
MSGSAITVLVFGTLLLFLVTGLPIVFCLTGVAAIFVIFLWGFNGLFVIASSVFGTMGSFLLEAVPLFLFMGYVLKTSGIGDDFYKMMHNWMGPVRGGLAMGTVVICTVFAAMAGISGAATVSMGIIAVPAMLSRKYDKHLALGTVAAGGGLGILIPPSLAMILYCSMTGVSVARIFLGGIFPGILLSLLFICYIGIKCAIDKQAGPALAPEERANWREKFISAKAVMIPAFVILLVLGSMYGGIATPTEAAATGALGTVIGAVINRRLDWNSLRDALSGTLRTSSMVLWLVIGGSCFCSVYSGCGAKDFLLEAVTAMPVDRYVILIGFQMILFFLGMFVDAIGIIMVATPVFVPVIEALGFNPLWFGIIFTINIEMGLLTPPFGINLFYLKAVAPHEITMTDLYRSVIPFVALHVIGLALVIIFPQIAMWLPSTMPVHG